MFRYVNHFNVNYTCNICITFIAHLFQTTCFNTDTDFNTDNCQHVDQFMDGDQFIKYDSYKNWGLWVLVRSQVFIDSANQNNAFDGQSECELN